MNDIRFALRQFSRNPGFTLAAILTLALAIGANTAIFSVLNAVILRPLPFPEPERLVRLFENHHEQNLDFIGLPAPAFVDWRAQNSVFEEMAAYQLAGFDLTKDGEARRVAAARVSSGLFSLLRVNPTLGRLFTSEEDAEGKKQVAILGGKLWVERFNAATDIVGKAIIIDGRSLTVVGVMSPEFTFDNFTADIWTPMGFEGFELENRGGHNYQAIGRLKNGASIDQARTEIQSIAVRLSKQFELAKGWGATLVPLHESMVGSSRRPLMILLGAVGFILLVACSNVANLLLARAAAREQEFALRASLGAGRSRIARQLLCERGALVIAAWIVGWLLAYWILAGVTKLVSTLSLE